VDSTPIDAFPFQRQNLPFLRRRSGVFVTFIHLFKKKTFPLVGLGRIGRPVWPLLREIQTIRSADWRSAVSPIANRRGAESLAGWTARGFQIRDTADGQLALRAPSRFELSHRSCDNTDTTLKKPKTSRRFFGTIFFGGAKLPEDSNRQRLRKAKNH